MTCARCGSENEAGRRFCNECGAPLQTGCLACGASNRPGARYCGDCGAALTAGAMPAAPSGPDPAQGSWASTASSAAPAARAMVRDGNIAAGDPSGASRTAAVAPVAERRLVTVLFADLVGFTTLSDGRDPEETRELLGDYFDLSREVIGRYGGVVEKFIGDAVMAVWGAPTAREDDPERAVRAGLDLVDAVQRLGPGIRLRAGVLTGEAAVTLGVQGQGMVAGDLVNTASRLQSVAPPGSVLVGESTMRASSAAIAYEPAGDQVLRGKEVPVAAFRALRVVAERGGRGRAGTLEAPFVGREEEFRLLKDQFHATGREQRTRLVSIVGPAGIGKSRLAWEFEKYLDGLVETVWWHHGRSPSYGEGVAFWGLGEMVRGRAGLLENDDEATTRARITATTEAFIPDEAERRWVEGALLALLGIGEVRSGGTDQLFAAWRTFFERISTTGTVALVFEDVQWADEGLLDFIDHLQEWSRGRPIYVLTLSRPELLERRPGWGAGKRHFTNLFLEPLSPAAMRELLAGMIPGLPDRTVDAILARADGVPLYAVETVRMLLEAGRLALRPDGTYMPTGDLAALAVPETLHALIAARLDALEPVPRAVLADASVLGQSFTPAALVGVTGMDATDLEPHLRSLVRRELLVQKADARSPERGQYAFVQGLIREVAYGTLAHRDRLRRHLAAALHFESLGNDELAGVLAQHYLAAYRNASEGDEAEALAAQARVALRGAAERAIALGAHAQAVEFLTEAVEVTKEPADRADLLERAGESSSSLGHHDLAADLLREALALRGGVDDRPAAARTMTALGQALMRGYRIEAAIALLESAAAEFGDLGDSAEMAALGGQLARAYMLHGDDARSLEAVDRVLATAEQLELIPVIADALITKGTALVHLGRPYEGLGAMDAGLRLSQANGLTRTELRAHVNIGSSETDRDPRKALEAGRAGIELSRRMGQVQLVPISNAAEVAVRIGEWDEAVVLIDEALTDDLDPVDRVLLLEPHIWVRALRGFDVTAQLEEIDTLTADVTDNAVLETRWAAWAIAALAAGDLDAAANAAVNVAHLSAQNASDGWRQVARAATWGRDLPRLREAVTELETIGVRGAFARVGASSAYAAIAALEGHRARAVALYRDVLDQIDTLRLPFERALVGIDMATVLGQDDPDAAAAASRARETLQALGARPLLTRLAALADGDRVPIGPATSGASPYAGTKEPVGDVPSATALALGSDDLELPDRA